MVPLKGRDRVQDAPWLTEWVWGQGVRIPSCGAHRGPWRAGSEAAEESREKEH